ncbi:transposase [Aquimarina mytili]|uniref:Transposase n=1 Tax=Aquimarina mytili TaxID=874423 RepID=A0A937A0Q4_9FLAO|nr:transposase [Aquimarina mytili]
MRLNPQGNSNTFRVFKDDDTKNLSPNLSPKFKTPTKLFSKITNNYLIISNLNLIFDIKLIVVTFGRIIGKLHTFYKDVEQTEFKAFNTIANTITLNNRSILNYFINRSTNASAESFNAKIKAFRAQFRGVKNVEFFLFRLTRIFA